MIGQTLLTVQTTPIWILGIINCLRGKEIVISVSHCLKRACSPLEILIVERFHLKELRRVKEIWLRWLKLEDAMKTIRQILPVSLGFTSYLARVLLIVFMSAEKYALLAIVSQKERYTETELTQYLETLNVNIE